MTTIWFDERGRITPEDLLTATFPVSRRGRRGYEEEAVREFLQAVHDEFVHLLNERVTLRQEVRRLRRRIMAGNRRGDPQDVLSGEQDPDINALRVPSTAYLRPYSDAYQADLRACTEGILHGIEEWERKEAASFEDVIRGISLTELPQAPGPESDGYLPQ